MGNVNKKTLVFDLLYYLCNVTIALVYYCSLRPPVDNIRLIIALLLFELGILIFLHPLIGKVVNSLLIAILFSLLTAKILNSYSIISLIVLTVFAVLYVKSRREYYKLSLPIRTIGILCLFVMNIFTSSYRSNIIKEGFDRYCVNLLESDFYNYTHFNNNDKFIEKFGMLSFIDKSVNTLIDDYSNGDEALEDINNYLNKNRPITNNDYTGLLKDKNIIIIQTTNLYDCLISEELTPNISFIKNNSINVKGFTNLITRFGASDVEMMSNLSLYPVGDEGCPSYVFDENYYDETLANIFNRNGYHTLLAINDYAVYYNRERMSKTYKYDDLISTYDYGLDGYQNDGFLLEQLTYNLLFEDKTMVYYISSENNDNNNDIFNDIKSKYPNALKEVVNKLCNLVSLDDAIGEMLMSIKETEKENDVVIVLMGVDDDETRGVVELAKNTGSSDCTDLFVFCYGLQPAVYEKKASAVDLLPTLANLFDMNYDNKTIIGTDIFDENYHGMQVTDYFDIKDFWYNDNATYSVPLRQAISYTEYGSSVSQFADIREKMKFSNDWLKFNSKIQAMIKDK